MQRWSMVVRLSGCEQVDAISMVQRDMSRGGSTI